MEDLQRTLVLIKPDGVGRGLIGEIISRFERRGLQVSALKMMHMDRELAARHYEAHVGKSFYAPLVEYVTSGPIVAMVVEGSKAVELVRAMLGATNPAEAAPGTIRGDLSQRVDRNCVHGSDSPESARREIALFFSEEEIFDYRSEHTGWL